ncbi:MAG: RagB/SusD family nutrient uptake outer membrane protein [Prolixibacteraceae bacterium]
MKNIINKLVILGIAAMAVTGLSRCSDVLDEVIYSDLTTANAFQTENDALATINGIYERQISVTNRSIFYLNDMPTDVCFMKNMPNEILNDVQMSNNQDVTASWSGYYKMVSRANIAIDNVIKIAATQFDDDASEGEKQRDALLAEAYYLRAFAFYQLSDLYYSIPMNTNSTTAIDANLPLTPIDKVEEQIIADLKLATASLPEKFASQSDAGRATLGAAYGMLCRVYMRAAGRNRLAGKDATAMWTTALEYANKILALESKGVYSLQPSVWNIFDPTNDAAKYNNELIYAVRANPNGNGTSDIGMNFTPWSYDMGWNLFSIPLELIWQMEPDDERLTVLIGTSHGDVYNPQKIFYSIPANINLVGTIYKETPARIDYELGAGYSQKYKYLNTGTYNYRTGNNMPILRLADIILCKAEILNELNGPTQESIGLINRIRTRAFGHSNKNLEIADYPSKEDLRWAICQERAFELNNEGVRRPDLIRMGLWKRVFDGYVAAIKAKTIKNEDNWMLQNPGKPRPDYSANWKSYPTDLTENDIRRYYPVPKTESDINPALLENRKFN